MNIYSGLRWLVVVAVALSACTVGCISSFPSDNGQTDGAASDGNSTAHDSGSESAVVDGQPDALTREGGVEGGAADGQSDDSALDGSPDGTTSDGALPDGAKGDGSLSDGPLDALTAETSSYADVGADSPGDATADVVEAGVVIEAGCGALVACGEAGTCASLIDDPRNCGACGNDCTHLANLSSSAPIGCSNARCTYTCGTGYADCADAGTGCVSIESSPNCGTCGTTCDAGYACSPPSAGAGYACSQTCLGGTTLCSGNCVNETSNNQPNAPNCGGCGDQYKCTGSKTCQSGTCACPSGLSSCPSGCTDTTTDNNNCGACTAGGVSHACPSGTQCTASTCVCTTAGLTLCPAGCVNESSDSNNCGGCGVLCTNGTTCQNGKCACPTNETSCGGTCTNLQTDNFNCGACNTATAPTSCPTGTQCTGGACKCTSAGLTLCGTLCVDESSDMNNCGGCGSSSSAYKCVGGMTCQSGTCACPVGQTSCNGTCTDTTSDKNNCKTCGTVCPAGTTCNQGTCNCTGNGLTLCGGACVSEATNSQPDASDCGGCGAAYNCSGGMTCQASSCACPSPETNCSGICTNLQTDINNCGGCGAAHACPAGSTCNQGQCVCTGVGMTLCGGACVNEASTATCGGCAPANVCPTGATCQSGTCVCPNGTNCSGTCEATQTDRYHCGSCTTACPTNAVCSSGTCTCTNGLTMCNGECADTTSDPSNCSACGHSCGQVGTSSGTCVNSTCQPFYLQTNAGALDAPMLVDTTLNTLYATLSQSAVESISTQTGVVTTSPAVSPFGGPNGMALSMDGTFLYMGVYNPNAAGAFGGIIAKLSKASLTSAVTLLASSQETETDFEWVGVVSGSAAPLCVQTYSPNGTPYNAQALLCGSSASGAPTLTVDSCSSGTTTSGTYCYACVGGPVLTPTACAVGNPANPANSTGVGAPTSAAADSNGLVWADAANIYSLSASNLAAKPTIVGSISGTETMGLMVVDANNVYWTYTINGFAYANRASRWASNTMTGLPFINDVPSQLAVDSTYLYWADTQNNEIMAVAINTLQSNNAIVIASAAATAYTPASGTLVNAPTAIAVDGTALYWYNSGTKTIAKMVKALQ